MGEKRLPIPAPDKPHFLACTAVEWLPACSRPDSAETSGLPALLARQ